MFKGHSILSVIPARGGSKGIPRKNIAMVAGKPLLSYTTEFAASLPWIDCITVSTDSQEIAAVAREIPSVVVTDRPEELSGDLVGDHPVLVHALEQVEKSTGQTFDIVIMLQPTSPLRTQKNVEDCISTLMEGNWDAVWTLSETELTYHPRKQLKVSNDGRVEFYIPGGNAVIARQQLEPAFHRNGVCYAFTREFLVTHSSTFSSERTSSVVIPGTHISIDTPEDLKAVEEVLAHLARQPIND